MSSATASLIDSTPWDELQHAYGAATDIPPLLREVAAAKGRKLYDAMDELCSRVLHQGTIYSASPAVARAVIQMLGGMGPRERTSFYGLLTGFASSARESIAVGHAIPCRSGGDPVDGIAIRDAILDAREAFVPDLSHSTAELRAQAAELLTAFAGASPAMASLVRQRYTVEEDARVRHSALDGLDRVRASFDDWPAFLATALAKETDVANRHLLRRAQVHHLKSAADSTMVDDLIATFVQVHANDHSIFIGGEAFFRTVHLLGVEREREVLLTTLACARNSGLSRVLAERLLRQVFDDQRTGWEDTSYTYERKDGAQRGFVDPVKGLYKAAFRMLGMALMAKLCPSILRRKLRKATVARQDRIEIIKYWGVKGDLPAIPDTLSGPQRAVLNAIAGDAAVWSFRTKLWEHFGLPQSAQELSQFVAARN
jgi:hypothetical protein